MKDKVRDISRSILPCKNREAARRAKHQAHRSERRGSREELSWFEGHLDRDELDECLAGPRESVEYRAAISAAVGWRRGGDKLGPFLRWARARTRTLVRPIAKYYRIRKLLGPATVITDHALGHFLPDHKLNPLPPWKRWTRLTLWPDRACLERLLVAAFESRHGELNAFLKAVKMPIVQTREDLPRLANDVWSLEVRSPVALAFVRFLRSRRSTR